MLSNLEELKQNRKAFITYAEGLTIAEKNTSRSVDGQFYFYRGEAFDGIKVYNEALLDYEQAIRLDSNEALAYNGKDNTLSKLKRYGEALYAFDQIIRLDHSDDAAYRSKGAALYAIGKTKRSKAGL